MSAWVRAERIPGAVLRVSRDGALVFERAYGWAQLNSYGLDGASERLARPIPMTVGTRFDLASVTKVMATTFAVMLLVDDGVLDLDAPVARWLPDLRGGDKERVTVAQLLTHRAGLPQWLPIYYHAVTPDQAYAFVRDTPLQWGVGEGRHYSDLGFMVLGRLVEAASGQSLASFLAARLYVPLGLDHTGYRPAPSQSATYAATSQGNPYERRMVYDSTFGYDIEGDPQGWDGWRRHTLVGEVNDGNAFHAWSGVAGHAGLFSTAADLDVLLQLLLQEGRWEGRRYLRPETVLRFLTPALPGQALGWQVPDDAPAGSFMHTGFTGTYVLGVPSRGLSVVLLTNRQNLGVDSRTLYPDLAPLQRAVASALLAEP